MNHSFKRVVETGYDRVAERYLASKDAEDPTTLAETRTTKRPRGDEAWLWVPARKPH